MKELSIEEKAKRYDEAIEKFDVILNLNTVKESGTIFADDVRKIFPELKESEDEKIRKAVVDAVVTLSDSPLKTKMLSWLEKQGEHDNFRNKIQIGDKVTRNEDGVLVNLSQLNRVAKKQGEQKPWSEEDELIIGKILCICDDFEKSFEISPASTKVIKEDINKIDNWLKSLKERYTWKPSDEQMDALRYVTNFDYGGYKATLVSLYEQLKKLRGGDV